MHTQMTLDDQLVQQATELAGSNNLQALVETLLREFVIRRKSDVLAQDFGQHPWEGNLDKMRDETGLNATEFLDKTFYPAAS